VSIVSNHDLSYRTLVDRRHDPDPGLVSDAAMLSNSGFSVPCTTSLICSKFGPERLVLALRRPIIMLYITTCLTHPVNHGKARFKKTFGSRRPRLVGKIFRPWCCQDGQSIGGYLKRQGDDANRHVSSDTSPVFSFSIGLRGL
jgi:hypothetical protein